MTTVPIIEIPIDDSAFKRFEAAFSDWRATVKEMPADWQATHDKISAIAQTLRSTGASAASAWGDAIALATKYEKTIKGSASAQQQLAHATGGASSAMARMEKHAKNIASSIFGAVRSMAKFATFGLGGGLLGLGGLSFGLDRLADAVLNSQFTAQGLGLTVGQLNSFRTNFAQVAGVNVLSGAALAQTQPQDWGFLAALGINPQQAQGESAAALAGQEILAVHRAWQQNPTLLSAAAISAQHLGMSPQDIRRIGTTPLATLQADIAATRRDAPELGFTAQVARDWADFSIQLHKAGIRIESALITALAPLTPQLGLLSKNLAAFIVGLEKSGEVKRWVNALAGGIHDFAAWLGSPAFKADMKTFAADVSALASATQNALRWFGLIPSAPPPTNQVIKDMAHPQAMSTMDRIGAEAQIRGQKVLGNYSPQNLDRLAAQYAAETGVPKGLIERVMFAESSFGKNDLSPAGAVGPMGLMPATARDWGINNPFNAAQNVEGGAKQLAWLLQYYHGDQTKAIAAYNAGAGAIDKLIAKYGADWQQHLPAETRAELFRTIGGGRAQTDAAIAALLAHKPAPAPFPHSFGTAPGAPPPRPPPTLARGTLPPSKPAPAVAQSLPPGMAAITRLSDMASVRSRYWQTQQGVKVKVENNTGGQTYVSANGAAQ